MHFFRRASFQSYLHDNDRDEDSGDDVDKDNEDNEVDNDKDVSDKENEDSDDISNVSGGNNVEI